MKLSISNLEQLSGVPVHTIRIWERRYNALNPLRSEGNTRNYTDEDLKRLLNIVGLSHSGMKISKACALSPEEVDQYLHRAVDQTISSNVDDEYYISQLLKFGLGYNEQNFNEILNNCIDSLGFDNAYQRVLFPLLQRLGLMWRRDHICPAQEHFISSIVRQKLMAAINHIPLSSQNGKSWMLFLPEDEAHDIPLLFASYLLRSNGCKVIYLGERVPIDSLKEAYHYQKVDNLLLFMVRNRPVVQANAYIAELGLNFADAAIHLAGNGKLIQDLTLTKNVTWFTSIDQLKQLIKPIANAG